MDKPKAIITGASEGIGRAFARLLAKEGYIITAVARNESRLISLVEELGGGPHSFIVADLITEEGLNEIVTEIAQQRLNLLINCAGFGLFERFYKTDLTKLQEMLNLNCRVLLTLSHTFLKQAKKGDVLINVSSALAFYSYPASALYAATKAFVSSLTDSLWYEHKQRGIYVMDLCPGITDTQFHQRANSKAYYPSFIVESPDFVANKAVKAIKKRHKPLILTGLLYKVLTIMGKLTPKRFLLYVMGKMSDQVLGKS